MTFRVLKPAFFPTGQVTDTPGGPIAWNRVSWRCIGQADSMEAAKEAFGGSPVLEWAGPARPQEIAERGREYA